MTDNGSSGGCELDADDFVTNGYNAGMRGRKGSYYDGGHRVPFFVRWPAGGLCGGRELGDLALHLDLLPTFIDLCDLPAPENALDGRSLAGRLTGADGPLPDRLAFLQYRQNTRPPEKWTNAVISQRWRLIHSRELYDIQADPGQTNDCAADHPDVVARLRRAHEQWWDEVAPALEDYCPIVIGHAAENPTRLDAFDLMGDVAWNQRHIRDALRANGRWHVHVHAAGRYEFRLQRWPDEAGTPIRQALQDGRGTPVPAARARLQIADVDAEDDVTADAAAVAFEADLPAGRTTLQADFVTDDGTVCAAYYVYIRRL
jgi:hypothetical protein